jgi:hypothetical protein
MMAIIGFYLSGVIAIAIIFIGCRFLLAPSTAAAAFNLDLRNFVYAAWPAGLAARRLVRSQQMS